MVFNLERAMVNAQYQNGSEEPSRKFQEARSNGVNEGAIGTCPRCAGNLIACYEEPSCLQCGYVDYHAPPSVVNGNANGNGSGIISKGTESVLRYVGNSHWLTGRVATLKVMRVRNILIYGGSCPFCGEAMQQSSLSGHRREIKRETLSCEEGHRVSLIPGDGEYIGWQ